MSATLEQDATWHELADAQRRHQERFQDAVDEYRHQFGSVLDNELERAAQTFAGEAPLRTVLAPIAERLHDYLLWLRWSAWLSTQLPPPLNLLSHGDRLRHAVAVVSYIGGRLVDDGIDGHWHYKNKRCTLVADIAATLPGSDDAGARCLSALTGFWLLTYGQRRMRQIGEARTAEAIERLYLRIPRGVLAEAAAGAITRDLYEAIVQHKSVAYDMLLYRSVLAPVAEGTRTPLLRALATASRIAQHLNDLADAEDDAQRQQPSLLRFEPPESIRASCLDEIDKTLAGLQSLDPTVRDAIAAVMAEVFASASSLWNETEPNK